MEEKIAELRRNLEKNTSDIVKIERRVLQLTTEHAVVAQKAIDHIDGCERRYNGISKKLDRITTILDDFHSWRFKTLVRIMGFLLLAVVGLVVYVFTNSIGVVG